jgi:hypothetical protein
MIPIFFQPSDGGGPAPTPVFGHIAACHVIAPWVDAAEMVAPWVDAAEMVAPWIDDAQSLPS